MTTLESRPVCGPVARSEIGSGGLQLFGPAEKPAMLLLHGIEDSWRTWQPFADRMADRFRCYAPELPWHAGSDYRWGDRTTAAGLIDTAIGLVPGRVSVLVAHSLGAVAVLRWLAASAHSGVDAVVLLSPFYRAAPLTDPLRTFEHAIDEINYAARSSMRSLLGARLDSVEPDVLDLMVRKFLDRMGPPGLFGLADIFLSTAGNDLRNNTIPIFVLSVAEDEGLDGGRAEQLVADIGNVHLVRRAGLSHFSHVEHTDQVHEQVSEFLSAHLPEIRS
ncbi:alpha/beta fold hydrolase [Nocardia crassostreae]|uniref:alpha/beta fold hydrolase n=1 Tax=Nocardia crassostreae TaxID=53428 RepID=UPI000832E86A|nr:alpha/beta hydrolase [Nocardia crassostreae]